MDNLKLNFLTNLSIEEMAIVNGGEQETQQGDSAKLLGFLVGYIGGRIRGTAQSLVHCVTCVADALVDRAMSNALENCYDTSCD